MVNDLSVLKIIAKKIRVSIIQSLTAATSGHLGGSLGLADVFTALYFHIMKHNPLNPSWKDRDRLILSIGHVAPVLYATLAQAGYFPKEELSTLREFGSRLQGHPGRDHGLPGIELSAGSLGQGLSVATGLALNAKLDDKNWKVYSIHGDGELQEGSIWEAAMSASHYKLNNLVAIVDRNGVQIDGHTEEVLALEPLAQKWESFGWNVIICDGHDFGQLIESFNKPQTFINKPSVIIANTMMGKGVSEIEGDNSWHGKAPSKKEALHFIKKLESEV